jgi:hypothetical protein
MVSVQAKCSMGDAILLMANTAASTDETLEQLAALVLDGSVRFD